MAADTAVHIVVITAPERLEQDWINRLAHEPDFGRVERVGVLSAALEMVQQTRPDLVIVDRDLEQTEACIRQIFTTLPATLCIAVVAQPEEAAAMRAAQAAEPVVARHKAHKRRHADKKRRHASKE